MISVICPCYNEGKNLEQFYKSLKKVLIETNKSYEILFINDGSSDESLNILKKLKLENSSIRIINLSRNFGKEAALTAGLDKALGEAIIPIDVDFQDPPYLITKFIQKWEEGYSVVLAKRIDRSSDTIFKSLSAKLFYKFHNKISDINVPEDVGDYRLISREVLNAIKLLPENQRFMKGIFSWVGFKTTTIEYKRESRHAGKSTFNVWKLWNLALEAITSFSTVPLRVWTYIGFFISFLSLSYGLFIITRTLIFGIDVPGYASLIVVILFLGGIQLIGIGVLGEYIGRIYLESKNRPVYIIESEL
ncbi:glycosyltransferase family 2 protein [Arcobacter arenosus]|uniref:Glycosyltransferase family 2 protein n=2 Tax=Arcobacter arenosus TaxID=2576037 RepID=A0A5R8Y3S5_9BACT|nr:glycosyltransferase family 2 protein [Arcobacter arenosus]